MSKEDNKQSKIKSDDDELILTEKVHKETNVSNNKYNKDQQIDNDKIESQLPFTPSINQTNENSSLRYTSNSPIPSHDVSYNSLPSYQENEKPTVIQNLVLLVIFALFILLVLCFTKKMYSNKSNDYFLNSSHSNHSKHLYSKHTKSDNSKHSMRTITKISNSSVSQQIKSKFSSGKRSRETIPSILKVSPAPLASLAEDELNSREKKAVDKDINIKESIIIPSTFNRNSFNYADLKALSWHPMNTINGLHGMHSMNNMRNINDMDDYQQDLNEYSRSSTGLLEGENENYENMNKLDNVVELYFSNKRKEILRQNSTGGNSCYSDIPDNASSCGEPSLSRFIGNDALLKYESSRCRMSLHNYSNPPMINPNVDNYTNSLKSKHTSIMGNRTSFSSSTIPSLSRYSIKNIASSIISRNNRLHDSNIDCTNSDVNANINTNINNTTINTNINNINANTNNNINTNTNINNNDFNNNINIFNNYINNNSIFNNNHPNPNDYSKIRYSYSNYQSNNNNSNAINSINSKQNHRYTLGAGINEENLNYRFLQNSLHNTNITNNNNNTFDLVKPKISTSPSLSSQTLQESKISSTVNASLSSFPLTDNRTPIPDNSLNTSTTYHRKNISNDSLLINFHSRNTSQSTNDLNYNRFSDDFTSNSSSDLEDELDDMSHLQKKRF